MSWRTRILMHSFAPLIKNRTAKFLYFPSSQPFSQREKGKTQSYFFHPRPLGEGLAQRGVRGERSSYTALSRRRIRVFPSLPEKVFLSMCAILFFALQPSCNAGVKPTTILTLSDGTRVLYETPPKELAHLSKKFVQAWLELNVCAIRAYYGRFPLREFRLVLKADAGSEEIGYGQAMPGEMPRITMYVGTRANAEEFRSSWVLCHEMTHTAFPSLEREYRWLEEGMATYVEPIARAMTGIISVESVWLDFLKKTPEAFENISTGLNGERDFKRVYWGGAVYFLLADIEIRRATKNKYSLQTALRAIMEQQGTMNNDADVLKVLRCGDKAISVPGSAKLTVLETLYKQFGTSAYKPNLEKLWQDIGIERTGETVRFRDDAPLAGIRKGICSRASTSCNDNFIRATKEKYGKRKKNRLSV